MVILASRPVGGYLGGKTAQGFDYLEQDLLLIIETDLCLFSSIVCFFSRVLKRIRWQLKVPWRELFTLVSSLLVSSHGQVEVRVGNILGLASPKAPVCVIRKPVCAKSSANFEANWKLVWLKDHCGNINPDGKSFRLPQIWESVSVLLFYPELCLWVGLGRTCVVGSQAKLGARDNERWAFSLDTYRPALPTQANIIARYRHLGSSHWDLPSEQILDLT